MFNTPQFHLVLNHFPIVGFILMVPIMIIVSIIKSVEYKRLALLGVAVVGLLAVPAYLTGEPAEDVVEKYPGISEEKIKDHEESAEIALVAALLSSGLALSGWVMTRKNEARLAIVIPVLTVSVLASSGFMAWVGHVGGKIRHPEIDGAGQGVAGTVGGAEKEESHDDD